VVDTELSVPPGLKYSQYTMISFVQWPEAPLLKDSLAAYPAETYRIGSYYPTDGRYVLAEQGVTVEPGRAYWCLARHGLDFGIRGIPVSLALDIDVKLAYGPDDGDGWNQVAPPNRADYLWSGVQVIAYDGTGSLVFGPVAVGDLPADNLWLDPRLWNWEGDGYDADARVLERRKGYWVKARAENVWLRFPATGHLPESGLGSAAALKSAETSGARSSGIPRTALLPEEHPPMPMR
jgi:hypothetical protein